MSTANGLAMFFNIICFALPLGMGTGVFFGYKKMYKNIPKKKKTWIYYNYDLFWAGIIIVCSVLLFQLYTATLERFMAVKYLTAAEEMARLNVIQNLKVFVFVVPTILLAVATSLIAKSMKTEKSKK